MILWRLTRRPYADLSGRGGELADGRWHTRGRPVVYGAASAALAVLEVRVHLDLPLDLLPDDDVLMKIEDLCRPIGDAWLDDAATALLAVPSAIIEVERNLLLNPRHPDAARIAVADLIPFPWDERLFR